jgi:DNA-binding NtrC family response regulator
MLERYDWPGNVRQLINAVERARIMADGRVLRVRDFPRETTEYQPLDPLEALQRYDDLATLERAKIVEVLRRERGNKTRAARSLGIDRRKLYRLVEKHRIESAELERALA